MPGAMYMVGLDEIVQAVSDEVKVTYASKLRDRSE